MTSGEKTPTDLGLDEKIMMAVVRASEKYKKESSAFLVNHGLTFAQYNVLRVLESSGNGRRTLTEVSRIMLVSGANTTGIVKRLEKNGFLLRKGNPRDERVTMVEITPRGRQVLSEVSKEKEANIQRFVGGLEESEKKDLLTALRHILKRPGESAAQPDPAPSPVGRPED
ncbi:MAG: MarR family transcriptional regulator [Pseudomonadota bacterium]